MIHLKNISSKLMKIILLLCLLGSRVLIMVLGALISATGCSSLLLQIQMNQEQVQILSPTWNRNDTMDDKDIKATLPNMPQQCTPTPKEKATLQNIRDTRIVWNGFL